MPEENNENDEYKINDEEIFGEKDKTDTTVIFSKEQKAELVIEADIDDASSFDELYQIIKQKKEIAGSKQKYKADYLITAIEDCRKAFAKITDKIKELIIKKDFTKETIESFFKAHSEFLTKFHNITRKEDVRLKVFQLAFQEVLKETK